MLNEIVLRVCAPRNEPVATRPRAKRRRAVRVSELSSGPANVFAKWALHVALCDTRSPRSCESWRKFCLWPADGVLLPPAAPQKVQSQSPAWYCARHVCPGELYQSPRAQTPRPACWRIFPRASLRARLMVRLSGMKLISWRPFVPEESCRSLSSGRWTSGLRAGWSAPA